MKFTKITRRSRKVGWGYSFAPASALGIKLPKRPDYIGTPKSVLAARRSDPAFNNRGGAFVSERFFINGKPILSQGFSLEMDLESLVDGSLDEIEVMTE